MGKSLTFAVALATGALITGVLVTGCNYGAAAFTCNSEASCGAGRHCETMQGGFCSVDDSSCPSGRRFVDLAGAQSNQCVREDMPPDAAPGIDAPMIDAAIDAAIDAPSPDARVCFGGPFLTICLQSAPTGTRNFSVNTTLDTNNAANCAATTSITPFGDYCVVAAGTINVSATLRGIGTKPLVLIAADTINVPGGGKIDVASHSATDIGAGADPTPGCAGGNAPGTIGGGAGGGFIGQGGDGGDGPNNNTGGNAGNEVPPPITLLRGGCRGQDGQGTNSGAGGRGGGVVYLIAGGTIDVGGDVNAMGGGGKAGGGTATGGGGGGGSGGMIGLDAPAITVHGRLVANGGSGGEGSGSAGAAGANGSDTPGGGALGILAAQGGISLNSAGDGGDGSAIAGGVRGQSGKQGVNVGGGIGGGGGGGGGAGLIKNPTGANLGTAVSPNPTL